ncbi:VOC family protein [Chachezhania sediminis]|uniref:VOC family protein n=1 Tax=Chachezhania sediminis TaxID=2599291 RepID=UPI00131E267C|nr:VOC family protein [Chachezhania sediminis]
MTLHLRQICLVAARLDDAISPLGALLGARVAHVDPAVGTFGLENALLALGTQFLEVVSPLRDGTAAGRFLARRGGDGGYMVITQVAAKAEQQAIRTRSAAAGVRVAFEEDRESWSLMQLHPADMGAAFLEVDWDASGDVTGNWEPAGGMAWQEAASAEVTGIVAAEMQAEDPAALAVRWAEVIGCDVERSGDLWSVALGNAVLRFVPMTDGRGPCLGGIDLACADPDAVIARAASLKLPVDGNTVTACGMRLHFVTP